MDQLQSDYLEPHNQLPQRVVDKLQPQIPFDVNRISRKIAAMPAYNPRQRLHFTRTGLEGHIEDIELLPVSLQQLQGNGSMSMTRRMVSTKNNVRGRSGQMPFTPGGLEIQEEVSVQKLHRDSQGLFDIAPGISRAPKFGQFKSIGPGDGAGGDADAGVNTTSTIGFDLERQKIADENEKAKQENGDDAISISSEVDSDLGVDSESDDSSSREGSTEQLAPSDYSNIDTLLPDTNSFVRNISLPSSVVPKERTWAHMVDINKKLDNFNELVPQPARTWPFELDSFQKEAVYRLEQGDSVFIAAHTSAGKTVVAEYAMSLAAQHMTKCIYTSPIKALSNQKYRDFKEEYDVGILTGDVQLNPEASTLIMTTEILRSMLYRGADVIRDVEFIIFDEVHYVNDSERGVVWEEVIIMLPDHVKLVLLSATVPNTFEFANWVGRTKEKDVYVISTPHRPVPLKHHLWLKKEMLEIVDEKRNFVVDNYKRADELVHPKKPAPAGNARGGGNARGCARGGTGRGGAVRGGAARGGARGGGNSGAQALQRQVGNTPGKYNSGPAGKQDLLNLVDHLNTKQLLPAVMFVFSRKMCEQYAEFMQSVSLNSGKEKSQVYMFMDKAVQRLRKEDRELPQIQMLRSLLQQGIGVHHSGLLPIMKEVVEILFARGLVKMLFATETFAMGLNLPTRTVVFTAVRKFDSKTMRYLSPGEYTQMAGRAGRRGLDSVGTVIIMNNSKDEIIPRSTLEQMLLGKPLKLSSQFRLTYNMILSLLRIEALKVEDVIQQSFSENANNMMRPQHQQKLLTIDRDSKRISEEISKNYTPSLVELSDTIRTYFTYERQFSLLSQKIYNFLAKFVINALIGHYVIHILTPSKRYAGDRKPTATLGLVYGYNREEQKARCLNLATLSLPVYDQFPGFIQGFPEKLSEVKIKTTYTGTTSTVNPEDLMLVSCAKFKGLKDVDLRQLTRETIVNIVSGFTELGNKWEEFDLNFIKSMDIRMAIRDRQAAARELQWAGSALEEALDGHQDDKQNVASLVEKVHDVFVLDIEAHTIQSSNAGTNAALLPEYGQRVDLLRHANYIDDGMIVALKGRVACEISTGYELYVTELIMDNFLGTFEPEEIVALLSVFVFEGARGAEDPPTVTPRLDVGKERLLELVEYVQKLADEHQVSLTQDEADFGENNRFALMQVVYEWARGMTFNEITQLTTIQEGTIVRVINRLDEVCRSVMSAARIIGEVELYDKLAIAQELIKRDIVFCSSLYL